MPESPEKTGLLYDLQPILDVLMASFATYIESESQNRHNEALKRLKLGEDKKLMDNIRELIRLFETSEMVLLAQREEQFNKTLNKLSLVNALSSIMILLMAMLASLFIYRESLQRILLQKKAHKELLFENEEKEKRAAELLIANKELLIQEEEKGERAAELIIANEELRIAATAFESQEGVVVTDADSIILRVNSAFTKITGYSSEEVVLLITALGKVKSGIGVKMAKFFQSISLLRQSKTTVGLSLIMLPRSLTLPRVKRPQKKSRTSPTLTPSLICQIVGY
jgi:PAS domain-containing protein